jgi:plasmid replication initiation protein
MDLEKTDKSPKLFTQDNELIEACYRMDLNEKRLLMLGMSNVNPMGGIPDPAKPFKFQITATDWQEAYEDVNAWQSIKRAADKLLTRQITLHPDTNVIEKLNWFDSVKYFTNKGRIEVQFTRSVQIRLAGMLERFTTIDLFSVNKLRSFYSVRLYEILSQFSSTGYRIISLEDFRYAMDSVKTNPNTKLLKNRVLNPAVKEINSQSDLDCTVKDIKDGKRITHFEFTFNKKPQQSLPY